MSFRTWMYVFAITGLALSTSEALSQAASENQPRQEDSTTDAQDGSKQDYPDPIDFSPALEGIEAAIRDLIAEEDKIETQRRQDAESRDLDAQEDMAKWAFLMTLATFGGVAATFAGLALIGRTLHHTRKAAEAADGMLIEAKSTTAAAIESAEAAKKVVFMERAWMTPSDQYGGDLTNCSVDGIPIPNGMQLIIEFKNTGRTPAIDCTIYTDLIVIKRGDDFPEFPPFKDRDINGGIVIPAGGGTEGRCILDENTTAAYTGQDAEIAIRCRVYYRDIFLDRSIPNHRRTVITLRATYDSGKITKNGVKMDNNSFRGEGSENYVT